MVKRININIKDNIEETSALLYALRAKQKLGDHGVVTFQNDVKVSLRKTKKGNDTFTVYK